MVDPLFLPEYHIHATLRLFDAVMLDYEQPDGGLSIQEAFQEMHDLLGITRECGMVKGYYRPITGKWEYKTYKAMEELRERQRAYIKRRSQSA